MTGGGEGLRYPGVDLHKSVFLGRRLVGRSPNLKVKVAQSCLTPWTVASLTAVSMGFSRQEYWSNCTLLQGNLPNQGVEPRSPALQADSLVSEPSGKPPKLEELRLGLVGGALGGTSQPRGGAMEISIL